MIMSPIFGIYLEKIGQKFLLVSGLITAATCSGLFSLLDRVVDSGMYFALGLILRSVQALGSAGYFTGNGHLFSSEYFKFELIGGDFNNCHNDQYLGQNNRFIA